MKTNAELKTKFEKGNIPLQQDFYDLIDCIGEGVYGIQNPPTLAQLTALSIKRGDYYIQTSNGSASATEIQRSLFNGIKLAEWTVTAAVWNSLSTDQKNAVEIFNITA